MAALFSFGCGDDGNSVPSDGGGDGGDTFIDAATDALDLPDANPLMPQSLAATGLYSDIGAKAIAADVKPYEVAFELWSDGAVKKRWIWMPPDTTIDTSDMNYWSYPEGTKLWKEFVRDGVLVETRLLMKIGPELTDWFAMPYIWNSDESDAIATPNGMMNARGTDHDVPAVGDCGKCHNRVKDYVLGFSAIQLDHSEVGANLSTLKADGLLSNPPTGNAPYYPIPGTAGTVAALGYLHANCGGCHNEASDIQDQVKVSLRLDVTKLNNVNQTPTYATAVDVPNERNMPGATHIVTAGSITTSALYLRMGLRDIYGMPPAGTELIDTAGRTIIQAWIESL